VRSSWDTLITKSLRTRSSFSSSARVDGDSSPDGDPVPADTVLQFTFAGVRRGAGVKFCANREICAFSSSAVNMIVTFFR